MFRVLSLEIPVLGLKTEELRLKSGDWRMIYRDPALQDCMASLEDYPSAYPLPACLVLGWNTVEEPIHTVWGYDRKKETARLITVYRSDPNRWLNWRIRKMTLKQLQEWAQTQIDNTAQPEVRPDIGITVLQLVDELE